MQALRKEDLFKVPGVAETIDWAGALAELDVVALDPATVSDTLGVLLKYQDDIARIEGSKAEANCSTRCKRGAAARRSDGPIARRWRDGRLAENIVYFARALRAAGMPVGPGAVLDALDAVRVAGIGTREDFYWTLHAVFVKRHEHTHLVRPGVPDLLRKRGYLDKLIASMLPQAAAARRRQPRAGRAAHPGGAVLRARASASSEQREVEIDARLTVSDRELLQKKDFAQMTADEIAAAKDGDRAAGAAARRGQDPPPCAASRAATHRHAPHACAPASRPAAR